MIFVVCLCGGPGVGKSTFAAQLCQEMHIRHVDILKPVIISYDDVAKNILGSHTFKEIRAITLNVMEREFLTAQYNVIILDDTMHYHSMRREVNARVRDLHGVMQTVWLKCDVEIAASRDAGRETPLGNEVSSIIVIIIILLSTPKCRRWFVKCTPYLKSQGIKIFMREIV